MIKDRIFTAYNMAKKAHDGQMRKYSDQEYFCHPKYVARMIEDITKDEDLIIVALLHDTIEDTSVEYEDIADAFGQKVSDLVLELTSEQDKGKMTKAEYLIDKMNKMSKEALIVKLADRFHNVKYLDKDCKTRQHLSFVKRYYLETVEILSNLNYQNKGREIGLLVRGIQFQLDYLECKHKW